MDNLLPGVLERSFAGAFLILAVLVARILLTQAPKWIRLCLWALVAVRLLLPVSIESPLSLIPSLQRAQEQQAAVPAETVAVAPDNIIVGEDVEIFYGPAVDNVEIRSFDWTWLWLAGVTVTVGYALISWWSLRRRILSAVRLEGNIFQSEFVEKPFVLGIIRPRIYLPFDLEGEKRDHVLAHERCHLRRGDHWWKLLGYGLLCVHWFNPLVWLAFVLFCRDLELACDERVVRGMDAKQRLAYSETLLALSRGKRLSTPCPLAFGEGDLKNRVKSILSCRKAPVWILALGVAVLLVLGLCFLTDPVTREEEPTLLVSDMTVVSGKNSVPLLIYPEGIPIRNVKNAIPYLTIDPTWEEFVPFRIYRGEEAVIGTYNAFDTKKFEPIGYKIPSGLEPQTYLFQNADIYKEYIVIVYIQGDTFCFGVKFDTQWELTPTLWEMDGLSNEALTAALTGISRETLLSVWGDPNDHLSSFFGDIFHIPGSFTSIIVYYDEAGFVERVRSDQRNQAV